MEKLFRGVLFINTAKKLNRFFGVIIQIFIIIYFTSGAICAAGATDAESEYLLSITAVEKDQFPQINLKTFFAEDRNGYKYPIFGGRFSASENDIKLNISVKKIAGAQNIALIIDKSLYNVTLKTLLKDVFKEAGSYIDGLDKIGIFGFTAGIVKQNFGSNAGELGSVTFDAAEYDYSKLPDDVFLYVLNSISQYGGNKHIIYITGSGLYFETDDVMNKIREINQDDSLAVHIIKLNFNGETGFQDSVSYSKMIELTSAAGGSFINEPCENAVSAIKNVMQKIKSNYEIKYETPQPYSNGRKRIIELDNDYNNQAVKTSVDYKINFNMPELQLENSGNPFMYQELDPLTIADAGTNGLSLSVSVRFMGNAQYKKNMKPDGLPVYNSKAVIGFASFTIDGRMCDELYLLEFTNDFKCSARKIKVQQYFNGCDLGKLNAANIDSERIETVFLKEGTGPDLKKCGIYWNPFFKNERYDQWVRIFMSFTPPKIDVSGNKRYAVFFTGTSADGIEKNIEYDGVQLQYGITPTNYSVDKTIYFGPEKLKQIMQQPINPRIEYQMK